MCRVDDLSKICLNYQGWIECAGIADRCDYDLKQHQTHSGQKLEIQRPGGSIDQTFLPHVIEPSFGISRLMLTLFEHSFKKRDKGEKHVRPSQLDDSNFLKKQ